MGFEGLFGPREPDTSQEQVETIVEETEVYVPDNVDSEDKQEKYKLYHSVKFTPEEEEMFQQIRIALGDATDSRTIKWLLGEAYSNNTDKIKRIVKRNKNRETL